jgi:hypothetical protein
MPIIKRQKANTASGARVYGCGRGVFSVMSKNNPNRLPRVFWPENVAALIGVGYNSDKN